MTIYTQLLRDRLAEAGGVTGCSRAELVADLVARRPALVRGVVGAAGLGAALDYDSVLARLCDLVGVPHGLVEPFPPPEARRMAEAALLFRLPGLEVLGQA